MIVFTVILILESLLINCYFVDNVLGSILAGIFSTIATMFFMGRVHSIVYGEEASNDKF